MKKSTIIIIIFFANAIIIVLVNVIMMVMMMMMIPTEASVVSKLRLGEVHTQPAVFSAGSSLYYI